MKTAKSGVALAALLLSAAAWSADSNIGAAISDSALTAKVKAALVADPDSKARQVSVDTSNAVVTLSGIVDNSAAKSSAEWTAKNVNGVASVENHLMVRAGSDTASMPSAAAHGDSGNTMASSPTNMAPSEADGLGAHDTPAIKPSPTGTSTYGAGPNDRTTVIASVPRSTDTHSTDGAMNNGSTVGAAMGVGSDAPTAATPGSFSSAAADASGGSVDSRVMQALKSDTRTSALHVDVKSGSSGSVVLSGNVASTTDRSAAADVARSVNGVDKIDNKIMVKKSASY